MMITVIRTHANTSTANIAYDTNINTNTSTETKTNANANADTNHRHHWLKEALDEHRWAAAGGRAA